jgi:mitogen-activated protein kinase 1/3
MPHFPFSRKKDDKDKGKSKEKPKMKTLSSSSSSGKKGTRLKTDLSSESYGKKGAVAAIATPDRVFEDKGDPFADPPSMSSDTDHDLSAEEEDFKFDLHTPPAWSKHWSEAQIDGRYDVTRALGQGSYGVVFEGTSRKRNECGLEVDAHVALKQVQRIFNTRTDSRRLLRELTILQILSGHDCIISLWDILPPQRREFDTLTLVFEFAQSDLAKIFRTKQNFTILHVQYICYQMLRAVKYMHSAGIVHRDIKPANVLINADSTIRLCDFGLARGFDEMDATAAKPTAEDDDSDTEASGEKKKKKKRELKRGLTRHVVTRWYRAPEVILLMQEKDALAAIDVWSIGCILAELFQMVKSVCPETRDRGPLFPGDSCYPLSPKTRGTHTTSAQDQLRVIFRVIGAPSDEDLAAMDNPAAVDYIRSMRRYPECDWEKRFPTVDEEAIDCLKQMLVFLPEKRVTIDEAFEHPFLSGVRYPELEKMHKMVEFRFEAKSLSHEELKGLICDLITTFNPEWKLPEK